MNHIYVEGIKVPPELFAAAEEATRLIKYNGGPNRCGETVSDLINNFDVFYVSFVAHNIDRFMSTIICQFNESYTQQSQRYVEVTEESIMNPRFKELEPLLESEKFQETEDFFKNRVIPFYKKVTEVSEGNSRGGRDKDKYIYGIPIEDARYVLPLIVDTTVDMTISFPELFEIYKFSILEGMAGWLSGFRALWQAIIAQLPGAINELINAALANEDFARHLRSSMPKYYKCMGVGIEERLFSVDVVKKYPRDLLISGDFNTTDGLNSICTAAYTSTKPLVKSKDVKAMDAEAKQKVIDRVTGYGHTSIEEHHQGLTKYSMSLSCYHQFLRHRVPTNRVNWELFDDHMTIHKATYIPKSIENSEFYTEYIEIMAHYRDLYHFAIENIMRVARVPRSYAKLVACRLVPNAAKVEVFSRSNLRADKWINRERLCMTASSEIRHLMARRWLFMVEEDAFYRDAVPPCFLGRPCKEGAMHCKYLHDIVKAKMDGLTVPELVEKFSLNDGE